MIKRLTAILFIMLAGFLLVSHAVVPHHHHDKQICLQRSHCIHDDLTVEHGTRPVSHSHDGENNHDDCALKDPVVLFSNESKPDFKVIKATDPPGPDRFHDKLLSNSTEFRTPVLSSYVYELVTDSLFHSLVSASHGLRAPPVV
jgi:hypothetical protein